MEKKQVLVDMWSAHTKKSTQEEAFHSVSVERTTAQLWVADQKKDPIQCGENT
jgi:hypothetical protein